MLKRPDTVRLNTAGIPNEKFVELDVKRGLRNADGSGVLAGLTQVCGVIGSRAGVACDGELTYRGISIEKLAPQLGMHQHNKFEAVCFLLLIGRLPNPEELAWICQEIGKRRQLSDALVAHAIKGLPSTSVMNKLEIAIAALYGEDSDPDTLDPDANFERSLDLIAKFATITAFSYLIQTNPNAKLVNAPATMSQAEAFLYMLREGQAATELEIEILDLCLLLHAEHGGGNNSTFATRVTTSSGTDIYSSIVAGIASLKGPLHGAANKMVMEMMDEIKSQVKNWSDRAEIKAYLAAIFNKTAGDKSGKIYGLGHAVYTKSDPRATVLNKQADQLAQEKGRMDEYQLYLAIAELGPEVFKELKGSDKIIAPNVDFFSGFVYDCLGIPEAVYTPMFAMARISGWCAHRIEEITSGRRIIRPSYKFVG